MSGFSLSSEFFIFEWDCIVVMVLQGEMVVLLVGQIGYIIQVLGGSFMVYVEGNLFCIVGSEVDVLGKELLLVIELVDDVSDDDVEKFVWQQLCIVFDLEILINVVEFGFVYDVSLESIVVEQCKVYVKMMFIVLGCGMGDIFVDDVCIKFEFIFIVVEVDVDLVFDLLWNYLMMFDVVKFEIGMF